MLVGTWTSLLAMVFVQSSVPCDLARSIRLLTVLISLILAFGKHEVATRGPLP